MAGFSQPRARSARIGANDRHRGRTAPLTPRSPVTPPPTPLRRAGLRRMRTVALGLLVFAAVVYVVTRDRGGFLGFVNAGAEASMVGAIADWFAVTALFRHPLGLPIPHTALIPKRKDDLGPRARGVRRRELPAGGDHPRPHRRGRDLAAGRRSGSPQPANAQRVVDEVAEVAAIALVQGPRRPRRVAGARRADAAVPGGADRAAARRAAVRGAPRRPPPRPGRPGPRGAARLAGREPRHGGRGDRRAGALVGAAPAQRGGDRPDPHRAGQLGRGHPRRPAAPRPGRARLGADPAGRRPPPRPRHPGPGRGAQGADPRQPGRDPLRGLALGRAAARADLVAPGPAGRRAPADADRGRRRSRTGSAPTPRSRRGSTGWRRTPPSSWWTGTAPR